MIENSAAIAKKSVTNTKEIVSFTDEKDIVGHLVLGCSLIVWRFTWWSSNSKRIPKLLKPSPMPFRTQLKIPKERKNNIIL